MSGHIYKKAKPNQSANPLFHGSKLALIAVCFWPILANAQDQCGTLVEVLRIGVDETEIASLKDEARRLYNWACSEEVSSNQARNDSSIEGTYELFGIGAKNNSSSLEEYRDSHCALSEQVVVNQVARNFRQKSVNPAVLNAWSECINQAGIWLIPKLDDGHKIVTFDIKYDDNKLRDAPILRGIRSKTFSCTTTGGGTEIGVGETQWTISSSEYLGITCERNPEIGFIGNREFHLYREDSLILDLSSGSYRINFAERQEGPAVNEFRDLQESVSALSGKWESMSRRLDVVNDRFGKLDLMLVRRLRQDSDCGTERDDSSSAPNCPEGWIDTDATFTEAWKGGKCGKGSHYRLCIRVDD